MARTARGHAAAGCGAGVLYFYCLLPGLDRHFFLRKSLFRFADAAIYSWTEYFSAARVHIASQSTRRRCRCGASPGFVYRLECRIHVSVGGALDSAARENFLEHDDSQPVPGGAAADRRALGRLSFSSPRLDASNRRPRHRPTEKTIRAVKFSKQPSRKIFQTN